MYQKNDHTFVICAYGESPYLESCILSLQNQSVQGKIMMSTSTPNPHIEGFASKYGIPLHVNRGEGGIAQDWNFAYGLCQTSLVTLAHQDDFYCENYLEEVLKNLNKSSRPLIAFTDYCELREKKVVERNRLLLVKRILLFPLRFSGFWSSIFVRRRILSLGSAICCPSVTLVKENLPQQIFKAGMKSNIDWEAWEKLSRMKGSFVYCNRKLMYHRIHQASTTSDIIGSGERYEEDLEMFRKFWPEWFCRIWEKYYSRGEKSNRV